ncbi:MAG: hypothetical protein RL291_2109 [Pseudomonadota bacterium]
MHLPDPRVPPLFTGHAVKAPDTPLATAIAGAKAGTRGAGDLIWSRNVRRATLALILEPEVPLPICGQMMPLAAAAVAETLGAIAPPQIAVMFGWPDAILINGGKAGSITLTAPADATDDAPPAWLILSIDLALDTSDLPGEPGERAGETCLYEEGAGDVTRTDVIEALSTRLLAWLHTWQHDGFRPIYDQYFFRVEREADITLTDHAGTTHTGRLMGLDETSAALLKNPDSKTSALPFTPFIARA